MARDKQSGQEARPYKVYAIDDGVVIDHIPARRALQVLEILGVHQQGKNTESSNAIVTLGMNMESSKLGRKDVVKIEHKELSKAELNKIALIAPEATVNIIHGAQIAEKFQIAIPAFLENIVQCQNQNCITNHERTKTKFITLATSPLCVKCYFCERIVGQENVRLLGEKYPNP